MKAVVVREQGRVLGIEEVAEPALLPHEVRIENYATALNRADLLQRRGLYPPPPGASEILGLECAGRVVETGAHVSSAKQGERVMALLAGGGYAERVVVSESLLIPIPNGLSFEQAAAIPEAFLTAREALFGCGRLQPGETVLVQAAASGVGSAAVQLARAEGATVIAVASTAEKLALATALGAQCCINYKTQDFADACLAFTGQRGVDVIVDFIGAQYAEAHSRILAVGGRQVIVGLLSGAKANIDLGQLLRKRQSICGMVMRTRSLEEKAKLTATFLREDWPKFAQARLKPVIDRVFPWHEVEAAHELMERNANLGKLVLRIRDA